MQTTILFLQNPDNCSRVGVIFFCPAINAVTVSHRQESGMSMNIGYACIF